MSLLRCHLSNSIVFILPIRILQSSAHLFLLVICKVQHDAAPWDGTFEECHLLNSSICTSTVTASEGPGSLHIVAYNPLAWPRSELIRVPVGKGSTAPWNVMGRCFVFGAVWKLMSLIWPCNLNDMLELSDRTVLCALELQCWMEEL